MNSQSVRYLIFLVALLATATCVYIFSQETDTSVDRSTESTAPHLSEYAPPQAPEDRLLILADTAAAAVNTPDHKAVVDAYPPASLPDTAVNTSTAAYKQPPTSSPVPTKKTAIKTAKNPVKKPARSKVKKYAAISFDHEHYDFGDIREGDIVNHTFTFTNTSDRPLEILSAKASCGCTTPTFPFITIPPGESHEINVAYHSVSKSGPQTPEITVTANTNPSSITLTMSGTVLEKEAKDDVKKGAAEADTETQSETPVENKIKKIKKDATTVISTAVDSLR